MPLIKCAFDDPGTRTAWRRARRRVVGRFIACLIVSLALLVLLSLYATDTKKGGLAGLGIALFLGLVVPCMLYVYIGSLLRLRRIRRVLRSYPWELRAAARKHPHVSESYGVAAQVKTGNGDDDWSPAMLSRNPLRWNRWDTAMESGAWFAGDPAFGGVVALPGGSGLMTFERRSRMSIDEFREIGRDAERMGRARSARIGKR
ncbi:hypothetical protein [Streptomyces altiplanensis]